MGDDDDVEVGRGGGEGRDDEEGNTLDDVYDW